MKTKLITQEPMFRPITIELTIESQEELEEWYARCNATVSRIGACGFRRKEVPDLGVASKMYCIIERELMNKPND